MSGKFYAWNGHTLVLDPGVFSWDLPRRGADWQVGYFPRDGMGNNGTVTSELDEAGEHLIRAGEAAVREVEPVIVKAPDNLTALAQRHPWMTLFAGMVTGAALWKYLRRRGMTANPHDYWVGQYVVNTLGAVNKVVKVDEDGEFLVVKDKVGHTYKWPYSILQPDPYKRDWAIKMARERGEI